jgi:L-aspartate oxidase
LSLRHLDPGHIADRFGRLAATVRERFAGLDLARDRLPIAPAAHYCMGGIRTDTWGRTDVGGLYAAGEVACSGVQGANRLASNSLLECLVFGARAAQAALTDHEDSSAMWTLSQPPESTSSSRAEDMHATQVLEALDMGVLGARLDTDLGVECDPRRLRRLVADLPEPTTTDAADLLLASLIARAALLRRESRGAHFRTDAPEPDPIWRGRLHWRRAHPPAFEEVPQ